MTTIGPVLRNTVVNVAITLAVTVAIVATKDANCLWGFLALFIVN